MTSAGAWLSSPVGVLKAFDGSGNATSALLMLADPHYDAATRTLSFKVLLLLILQRVWGRRERCVADRQPGHCLRAHTLCVQGLWLSAWQARVALGCTALYYADKR